MKAEELIALKEEIETARREHQELTRDEIESGRPAALFPFSLSTVMGCTSLILSFSPARKVMAVSERRMNKFGI